MLSIFWVMSFIAGVFIRQS